VNHADLGHAIDQLGHLVTEVLSQYLEPDIGIFNDVMNQSRRNGGRVKMLLGQNESHFETMFNIRFARLALLSLMSLIGELISFSYQGDVDVRIERLNSYDKLGEIHRN